jgi:hypothetical protein
LFILGSGTDLFTRCQCIGDSALLLLLLLLLLLPTTKLLLLEQ